jgi:hypothetical protein
MSLWLLSLGSSLSWSCGSDVLSERIRFSRSGAGPAERGATPCRSLATGPLRSYVASLRTVRAGMTSPYRIERDRGTKEASQQLAVLREKWPLAFPVQHQDVRPLAMGVARQVAAAMGWSLPYTLGVLGRWKMATYRDILESVIAEESCSFVPPPSPTERRQAIQTLIADANDLGRLTRGSTPCLRRRGFCRRRRNRSADGSPINGCAQQRHWPKSQRH